MLLSPLDWAQIEKWRDQGIPLRIVLRGIDRVFDKFDKDPNVRRGIKSLSYCREEIEAQYAEWLESQVGSSAAESGPEADCEVSAPDVTENADGSLFPADAVEEHLNRMSAELADAIAAATGELLEVLERTALRLAKLVESRVNAADLEKSLEGLDDSIDRFLRESLSTEALRCEVRDEMAAYAATMDKEAYRKTFEFLLSRRLRERHQIPRLSLFIL